MSFRPNLAPSALVKISDEDESQKLTKGDYKQMKELEEARKSAQLPAMKDERGKDINPHIPQYIMSAPWYYNSLTPTLRHQRKEGFDDEKIDTSVFAKPREIQKIRRMTKFRKGACENCGAEDHKRKDCLEKPRKILAKYSDQPIEVIDIKVENDIKNCKNLSYDAKRDRYNNYDESNYSGVIERYSVKEELSRQSRSKELEEQLENVGDESDRKAVFESAEIDETRTGDDVAMPGQKFDAKQRQSIRNLRLREDIPKYLLNLDPDSAFYDPKSRSMRGNPFEHTGKSVDEVPFAGDNYIRYEDDAKGMLQSQVFSWEMGKRGVDIHFQADPTRVSMLQKETLSKTNEKKHHIQQEILQEYGGEEYLEPPPSEIIYGESSTYFEYDMSGKVVRGPEKVIKRSIYEEDVIHFNHTAIWGSFWLDGKWGYKCCKQLTKNCYCIIDNSTIIQSIKSIDSGTTNQNTKTKTSQLKFDDTSNHQSIWGSYWHNGKWGYKCCKQFTKNGPCIISDQLKSQNKQSNKRKYNGNDNQSYQDNSEVVQSKKSSHEIQWNKFSSTNRNERQIPPKKKYNSDYEIKVPTDEEMSKYKQERLSYLDPMAKYMDK